MISDQEDEDPEFLAFGSGQLLHDLLMYVNPHSAGIRRKIIFVGDPAQLPPVGSSHSPALDADYLSAEYYLPTQEFTLTEVVRQKAESGILTAATAIRESIRTQSFHTIVVDDRSADISHVSPEDFLSTYLTASKNEIDGSTVVVTYSNRAALEYNRRIREHFFPHQSHIYVDDKIIVVRNSYNNVDNNNIRRVLFNGEFGKVLKVSDRVETKTIPFKTKGGIKKVRLDFRDVVIRFWDSDGKGFDVPCKIIDSLLDSPERSLTPEETRALYVDFKMRYPYLKPKTLEFQRVLLDDSYFNAMQIKFGYAITCHKAQGGEWPHVFVDFDTHQGQTNEDYFRWVYTAITRAEWHLYAINPPHQTAFSTMTIADIPSNSSMPSHLDEDTIRADIRRQVEEVLRDTGIIIEGEQHNQHCEVYTFTRNNQHCQVDIWFKKTGQISRIIPRQSDSALAGELRSHLAILTKQKPVLQKLFAPAASGQPDMLQQLRHRIEIAVTAHNIQIVKVDHHQYQEAYLFQKNGQSVQFNFYYNSKGQFTTTKPHPNARYAPELLAELTKILREVSQ